MSSIKRAMRLVELRQRATDAAKSALAIAEARVRQETAVVSRAETAWNEAAEKNRPETVGDAIEGEALLVHLARDHKNAERERLSAVEKAEAQRSEAIAAQRDLRKLELWTDGLKARAEHEASKAEQRLHDEAAARRTRR